MSASTQRKEGAARIRQETPISLETAATIFPRGKLWETVSIKSVRRWVIGGKAGVRLEAVRIKGELHTSVPAIKRFVEAVEGT